MNKDIIKSFIGKIIRVDRGGPESRIGKLMDASEDHIVLLTKDEGVVYYNTKHINRFTDKMKGEMKFNIEVPKNLKFIKAANFQDLLASLKLKWVKINRGGPEKLEGVICDVSKGIVSLVNNKEIVRISMVHIKNISNGVKGEFFMNIDIIKSFIGKVIRVDRGGPESRIGKLMDGSEDHIVLFTEDDGVVYYNTKHIKSFTDNMKEEKEFKIEVPKNLKFKKAANFQDLLDSLKLKWVKINRGGPEKLEGVICDVSKDIVSLVNNEEIVRLSIVHIKNISKG
ncbi:hypothetical protein V7152_12210 [Neobacillus drentensis]|uniref:hypothetical protein n=1 Tax=Neobacillus drentensis TaxID=220684 RepID=UPI002FFEEED5